MINKIIPQLYQTTIRILAEVKFYKFLQVEEFTLRRKVETGIVQIHRGLNLYR